jgi:hypothetical protein
MPIVLVLLLTSGCQTRRAVTFTDGQGYDLLKAARHVHVGDTRQQVMRHLGWRRDQAFVEAGFYSAEDGGGMIHPQLNIWHWNAYPIDIEVGFLGFRDDGRVWRVWYEDDTIKPNRLIILTGPKTLHLTQPRLDVLDDR